MVLYNVFGLEGELKPGRDMNRTITHEMGHHLSLYHTFHNTTSCSSETNCDEGDEVCDTCLLPLPTTKDAARPFARAPKWRTTWTTRLRIARMPSLRANQNACTHACNRFARAC